MLETVDHSERDHAAYTESIVRPTTTTRRSSEDTVENARANNPNGSSHPMGGVSVHGAEADFAQLQRELTGISNRSRQLSRTHSRASSKKHGVAERDVEKVGSSGSSDADEQFDLEATLRGSKAADDEAGIRSKRIGVLWEGLTVKGVGGSTNFVKTFPDAFVSFFNVVETAMHLFGVGKKAQEINILEDFRGVVRPGEMVLVLGRPGSGCTTFLKLIANQRFGYTDVTGDVEYGPFDAATFSKKYRGEAVYNQEEEVHLPTLTVGQTLGFALDTKTPEKRPSGMSKRDFKERVTTTLLKMFNIEHTRNTVVGNAFMRGVSGGERKRVSIAEMMITNASGNFPLSNLRCNLADPLCQYVPGTIAPVVWTQVLLSTTPNLYES